MVTFLFRYGFEVLLVVLLSWGLSTTHRAEVFFVMLPLVVWLRVLWFKANKSLTQKQNTLHAIRSLKISSRFRRSPHVPLTSSSLECCPPVVCLLCSIPPSRFPPFSSPQ